LDAHPLRPAFAHPTVTLSTPLVNSATYAIEIALGAATSVREDELRAVMRELCGDAHRQGVRPEALILLLKNTWMSRPDLAATRRGDTKVILDHIITLCIEEYYATA
jgi:hypothetical protein